jgi:hypothetical protein
MAAWIVGRAGWKTPVITLPLGSCWIFDLIFKLLPIFKSSL